MTTSDSKLLTCKQVAEKLSISTQSVSKWTREKKIPHIRFNRRVIRYEPAAIEAMLLKLNNSNEQQG